MPRNVLMLTFLKDEFQMANVMTSFLLFPTFSSFDKHFDVASKTRIIPIISSKMRTIPTIFQLQIKISSKFRDNMMHIYHVHT